MFLSLIQYYALSIISLLQKSYNLEIENSCNTVSKLFSQEINNITDSVNLSYTEYDIAQHFFRSLISHEAPQSSKLLSDTINQWN